MNNSRYLSQYLLRALVHKVKSPLSILQNDLEYYKSIYNNDEFDQTQTAVKKINNLLDNAFLITFQEGAKEELDLSKIKELESFCTITTENKPIKILARKVDVVNYFYLLYSVLKSLNLLISDNTPIYFELNDNLLNELKTSFKPIKKDKASDLSSFSSLSSYINMKNDIDSIDAILSDLLLEDLGFSLVLEKKDDLMYLKILLKNIFKEEVLNDQKIYFTS